MTPDEEVNCKPAAMGMTAIKARSEAQLLADLAQALTNPPTFA